MSRTPVTKDKRRQKRIIAAAQRQSDKLGIAVNYRFNEDGQLLIDGKTEDEINAQYDKNMKEFLKRNKAYLDPYYDDPTEDEDPLEGKEPAPIYELPPFIGPLPKPKQTHVHKFEQKKDG